MLMCSRRLWLSAAQLGLILDLTSNYDDPECMVTAHATLHYADIGSWSKQLEAQPLVLFEA